MQRIPITPRHDWVKIVESQGLHFHTFDDQPYWDESVYYRFSAAEIDVIEKATYALNEMCLTAVEHVISEKRFEEFLIPDQYIDFVLQSWERDEFTIYGRFDLVYDGMQPPKLLEYNADTPTALLEAGVIQWFWFKDLFPSLDQFNSIHERLIEAWTSAKETLRGAVYFAALRGNLEDYMTVNYLRDTANQAGLVTEYLSIEDIGWNEAQQVFVDLQERPMRHIFKLYPWEWMLGERFGRWLPTASTQWLEAPWKMLLSNKAILVVLHELFPDSPYLLEASFEPITGPHVRKPRLSREGANVALIDRDRTVMETDGVYPGPYVYQRLCSLPNYGGNYPVIGSWMVNGYVCGIGIREDSSPITQNSSRFVPHVMST